MQPRCANPCNKKRCPGGAPQSCGLVKYEVIEKVRDFHGRQENSRFDRVIYDGTDRACTGIVTTCAATVEVIKKARALGANLVICHEPVFLPAATRRSWSL